MTITQNGHQIMRDTRLSDWDGLSPAARSAAVKREALALGADFAGIGAIERWRGAPRQMDPKQIMPVPPPTLPSGTGPERAPSSAANTS